MLPRSDSSSFYGAPLFRLNSLSTAWTRFVRAISNQSKAIFPFRELDFARAGRREEGWETPSLPLSHGLAGGARSQVPAWTVDNRVVGASVWMCALRGRCECHRTASGTRDVEHRCGARLRGTGAGVHRLPTAAIPSTFFAFHLAVLVSLLPSCTAHGGHGRICQGLQFPCSIFQHACALGLHTVDRPCNRTGGHSIRLQLRGGRGDHGESYSDVVEGPAAGSSDDEHDEPDFDLDDLSEAKSDDGGTEGDDDGDPLSGDGKNEGEGLEDLLNKFMDKKEDESDSQEISNEWVRDLPETAKDHPEFMAEFDKLHTVLVENQKYHPLPWAERVKMKFVMAAQAGKDQRVKAMFRDYSDRVPDLVDARDWVNITAMMHAAANGHLTTVKALLKRGADADAVGSQTETVMHLAASEGMSEICVLLYEHAPHLIHMRDSWNTTPIMRSIDQGWAHTSKTLYNLGSKLDSFGLECSAQRLCSGMRWPIMRRSRVNDTSVICPLCMYGYIFPDSPFGDGHVTDFCALLPPEFYPNPFLGEPKDGCGPARAGPGWEPITNGTRQRYNGSGTTQQWPHFGDNPAPILPRREKYSRFNF